MNILAGIFHHGLIVDDIEAAMAGVAQATPTQWAPVRAFDPLPVWSPAGGRGEARLRVAYARQGAVRMELVEAQPGSPYDHLRGIDPSHIGVWVDDLGSAVDELVGQGWEIVMAGASPKHRFGSMAYLARAGSPVIELVGRELQPMMEAWWQAD
ncbi:MAG: VOC family protein [Novosphingobium sp.]|nr:VOC family protein [Novosphingobium sp.]